LFAVQPRILAAIDRAILSSVIVVISKVRVACSNPTLTRSTTVTTAVDK
jgi:hypothetical protein